MEVFEYKPVSLSVVVPGVKNPVLIPDVVSFYTDCLIKIGSVPIRSYEFGKALGDAIGVKSEVVASSPVGFWAMLWKKIQKRSLGEFDGDVEVPETSPLEIRFMPLSLTVKTPEGEVLTISDAHEFVAKIISSSHLTLGHDWANTVRLYFNKEIVRQGENMDKVLSAGWCVQVFGYALRCMESYEEVKKNTA